MTADPSFVQANNTHCEAEKICDITSTIIKPSDTAQPLLLATRQKAGDVRKEMADLPMLLLQHAQRLDVVAQLLGHGRVQPRRVLRQLPHIRVLRRGGPAQSQVNR